MPPFSAVVSSSVAGQPATAYGVAIIYVFSRSGHVADTQVGKIPGYAQLPPPPGWLITSPLVIVSADGGEAGAALRQSETGTYCSRHEIQRAKSVLSVFLIAPLNFGVPSSVAALSASCRRKPEGCEIQRAKSVLSVFLIATLAVVQ